MRPKLVAVALLAAILASCSASTGSRSPSQEELEDARTHLQAVRAAMDAYEEAGTSLPEWRDPSGPEAVAAIERMAQALKSVEATAADYRITLLRSRTARPDLAIQALGSVVSQNAEAARAAWEQARPEFEAWLLRGKSVSRAEMLRSFDLSYGALDTSIGHAEHAIDRLKCEGSGGDWDADLERCA
jgi:hypothetical protein